jgi:ribosomal protein S18 acetylase RimI-like enzyme
MFQIRLATPDDMKVILELFNEASAWLRRKNTDQWSRPWPDEPERDARVLRGLLACRTWLVEDRGTPVATITCRPEGYGLLWSEKERAEPAAYVSRLIVARDYAGEKIGEKLIDWAAARARREWGAESVRIDVWTTNEDLHRYYEERGFKFLNVRIRFLDAGKTKKYPSAALFSKPIKDAEASDGPLFWEIPAIPGPVAREIMGPDSSLWGEVAPWPGQIGRGWKLYRFFPPASRPGEPIDTSRHAPSGNHDSRVALEIAGRWTPAWRTARCEPERRWRRYQAAGSINPTGTPQVRHRTLLTRLSLLITISYMCLSAILSLSSRYPSSHDSLPHQS